MDFPERLTDEDVKLLVKEWRLVGYIVEGGPGHGLGAVAGVREYEALSVYEPDPHYIPGTLVAAYDREGHEWELQPSPTPGDT